jgi:hypothetical protein
MKIKIEFRNKIIHSLSTPSSQRNCLALEYLLFLGKVGTVGKDRLHIDHVPDAPILTGR